MEPTKRSPRKTVDDIVLPRTRTKPVGQAMRFENEIKIKAMTLGRQPPAIMKRKPKATQDTQQDLRTSPPPPPARIQSKRGNRNRSNRDSASQESFPEVHAAYRNRSNRDSASQESFPEVHAAFPSSLSGTTPDGKHQSERNGTPRLPRRSKSFMGASSFLAPQKIKNPPPLPEEIQPPHTSSQRSKSLRWKQPQHAQYNATKSLPPTTDDVMSTTEPDIGMNGGPSEYITPTTTQSLEIVSDSTLDGNVGTTMYNKGNRNNLSSDRHSSQSRQYGSAENHTHSGQQGPRSVPLPPEHHPDVKPPPCSNMEGSQTDMIKESSSPESFNSQSASSTQEQSEADNKIDKPSNVNCKNDGQDSIDMLTIVSSYKQFLPTNVQIVHGYMGSLSLALSFAQFDRLHFHFVKISQVAVLHDGYSQEKYSIPLSSAVSFGLTHESESYGSTQTVEDIMNMKPLPQVILTKESFNGGSVDKSVEENDLLFVKEISKSQMFKKGKVLKVLSIDHGVKTLSSKCTGKFSLHPEDIQMTLATMVAHSIQLPQKVYLFSEDFRITRLLPERMRDQPVMLESLKEESSIICTFNDSGCPQESQKIIDIHTNISIKVKIQPVTGDEKQKLHDMTSVLYHTLDLTQLEFAIDKETERGYNLQCLLYKTLVPGREKDGVSFHLNKSSFTDSQSKLSEGGFQENLFPNQTSNENISSASSFSDFHDDGNNDGIYEEVGTACASLSLPDAEKLRQIIQEKTPAPVQSKLFKKSKLAVEPKKKKELDKGFDHKLAAHPLSQQIRNRYSQGFDSDCVLDTQPANQIQKTYGSADLECYESVSTPDMETETINHTDTQGNHKSPFPITTHLFNNQDSSTITQSQYAQLNTKISRLVSELDSLKLQVQTLTTAVRSLKTNNTDSQSVPNVPNPGAIAPEATRSVTPGTSGSDENDKMIRNREFLATLTCDQVQQLLANMSLSQYSSEFAAQGIAGNQLLEIDENALLGSFQMTSKFHQKKLVRVISGAIHAGTYVS